MSIKIMSRRDIESYEPTVESALISIKSPNGDEVNMNRECFVDILDMEFNEDINPGEYSFNIEMAKAVLEFNNRNREIDEIVIHCDTAINRSPAIAFGLAYERRDVDFAREILVNKLPNNLVINLMKYQIDDRCNEIEAMYGKYLSYYKTKSSKNKSGDIYTIDDLLTEANRDRKELTMLLNDVGEER